MRCPCVQVRVFELGQLGMKFERHLDAEVVDFQVPPLPPHPPPPRSPFYSAGITYVQGLTAASNVQHAAQCML